MSISLFSFFYLVKYLFYLCLSDNSQKKETLVLSKYGLGDFKLGLSFMFIHVGCDRALEGLPVTALKVSSGVLYSTIEEIGTLVLVYGMMRPSQTPQYWSQHIKVRSIIFRRRHSPRRVILIYFHKQTLLQYVSTLCLQQKVN